MCTVVILHRPGHDWPVVLGANRDEMVDRPWRPPARHWPDRPEVAAGMDELAGGTWMGMNDMGVAAAILNREGTLGPAEGKRSRGELPLEALDHAEAAAAVEALEHLNPDAYRPFNMVVADRREVFWLRNTGDAVEGFQVEAGLNMLTAHDLNDVENSPRQKLHLPRFRAASHPDVDKGDWAGWEALLASRDFEGDSGRAEAMCVVTDTGFCTTSSSLIALPSMERPAQPPAWLFCAGRPGEAEWAPVER